MDRGASWATLVGYTHGLHLWAILVDYTSGLHSWATLGRKTLDMTE